jgi:RimJ/RimL family protein N-acetyltransferase
MIAADYSVAERLRDGRAVHIRALRPTDRDSLLAAFERSSDETRYRRVFAPKKSLTPAELDRILNVDFVDRVALAAFVREEDGSEVLGGAGRYVLAEPGCAELAFTVDDPHQNIGIGTHLMRHLVLIASQAGLRELIAEVLSDNAPMFKVFERSGLDMRIRHHEGIAHVRLGLARSGQDESPQANNPNAGQ